MNKLAERIRERLEELGWTQTQLERESGVPRRVIYRILTGKTGNPRYSTKSKLFRALGITELSVEDAEALMEDKSFAILWLSVLQDPQQTGFNVHKAMIKRRETAMSLRRKTGIPASQISAIVGGVGLPLDCLVKLCEALDVRPTDLVALQEGIQFKGRQADADKVLKMLRESDSETEEFVRRISDLWNYLDLSNGTLDSS